MEQERKRIPKLWAKCCQVLMCLMVLLQYTISHPSQSTTSIGSAQSWRTPLWDCSISQH